MRVSEEFDKIIELLDTMDRENFELAWQLSLHYTIDFFSYFGLMYSTATKKKFLGLLAAFNNNEYWADFSYYYHEKQGVLGYYFEDLMKNYYDKRAKWRALKDLRDEYTYFDFATRGITAESKKRHLWLQRKVRGAGSELFRLEVYSKELQRMIVAEREKQEAYMRSKR